MSREDIVANIATLNKQLDDLDREAGRIRPDGTRYYPRAAFRTRDIHLAVKIAEYSGGAISCSDGLYTIDFGNPNDQTWVFGQMIENIIEEHTGAPYRPAQPLVAHGEEYSPVVSSGRTPAPGFADLAKAMKANTPNDGGAQS